MHYFLSFDSSNAPAYDLEQSVSGPSRETAGWTYVKKYN